MTIAATLTACGGGSSSLPLNLPPPANGPVTGGGTSVPPDIQPPSDVPVDDGPVKKWGYIELPDGNKMRYSVLLPRSTGSFPVLIEYDGYGSGFSPDIGKPWVAEGYAVMGLNVPGTGCSTGDDQVIDASVGAAGAYAVEWAGKQPWSNGRIGMVGYSYAGFTQLWVAARQPAGLLAISPGKSVADIYRDVGYPGGIQNVGFPSLWWGNFPILWNLVGQKAKEVDGDTECERTVADSIAKVRQPQLDWNKWLNENPHYDALYAKRSAMFVTNRINIPTLGTQAWQDEEVGTRMGHYEDTVDPEKLWFMSSNGDHHTSANSDYMFDVMKRFYARFVKGEDNGFEREPHVRLLQELQINKGPGDKLALVPTSVAEFDRLPVHVTPMRLWLQAGGGLSDAAPTAVSASSSYEYPVRSPAVNNPQSEGWEDVNAPEGHLSFTTGALPQDLSFYGEGSADLWLSATAADTDLQVTVSEVRSDGMEMYVQRGWLRASKRQLDLGRSTALRPWGDFTEAAVKPMKPGEPTQVRLALQKFAHVFRAGSSIRVTIDTPSQTGYWAFGIADAPSINTVWHDKLRLSSIVLGYLPYAHAKDLPGCLTTQRQPCRKNLTPVPAGSGPIAPT
ncbi:CocE/NonD family hydrolase [Variovorax sp. M-6]|uniref:CocE/NonD family hydrolase n=1 Tax=Variovorax sp. M-6 TaxID=3233041 RepID=UPI003F99D384